MTTSPLCIFRCFGALLRPLARDTATLVSACPPAFHRRRCPSCRYAARRSSTWCGSRSTASASTGNARNSRLSRIGALAVDLDGQGTFEDEEYLLAFMRIGSHAIARRLVDDDAAQHVAGERRRQPLVGDGVGAERIDRALAWRVTGLSPRGWVRKSPTSDLRTRQTWISEVSEGTVMPRSICEMKPTDSPAWSATSFSVRPSSWRRSRRRVPSGSAAAAAFDDVAFWPMRFPDFFSISKTVAHREIRVNRNFSMAKIHRARAAPARPCQSPQMISGSSVNSSCARPTPRSA